MRNVLFSVEMQTPGGEMVGPEALALPAGWEDASPPLLSSLFLGESVGCIGLSFCLSACAPCPSDLPLANGPVTSSGHISAI